MTYDRMMELLEIEHKCSQANCDRDCYNCELVQDSRELNMMYKLAIRILRETTFCESCKHFIGAGDWNLCCDLKYDLCYKYTPACTKYEPKN